MTKIIKIIKKDAMSNFIHTRSHKLYWGIRRKFIDLIGSIELFNDNHFECDDCGGIFHISKMQKIYELIPHVTVLKDYEMPTLEQMNDADEIFQNRYCKHCAKPGQYYFSRHDGSAPIWFTKNNTISRV